MDVALPIDARTEPSQTPNAAVSGGVAVLLRAEALVALVFAVAVYRAVGGGWLMFALLFLVPDLSMLGYLANPRMGARLYNAGHTYLAPALLGAAGFLTATPLLYALGAIWVAHIGFDRMLGYGLKYPVAFGATHLGRKGVRGADRGSEPVVAGGRTSG